MAKILTLLIMCASQVPSLLFFSIQGHGWHGLSQGWLQSRTTSTSQGKTPWNGNSIQGMCNHIPRSKQEFNTTEVPFEPGRVKLSIKEKNRNKKAFSNPPLNYKDIFHRAGYHSHVCIPHPAKTLPVWEVPLLIPWSTHSALPEV